MINLLSEWTLKEMAEVGVTEKDVLAAFPKNIRDHNDLGNYLSLEDLKQAFEGKPEDAYLFANEEGSITLNWERSENVFEVAKRLVSEAKRARAQEIRDREEFERLKAKYEEK